MTRKSSDAATHPSQRAPHSEAKENDAMAHTLKRGTRIFTAAARSERIGPTAAMSVARPGDGPLTILQPSRVEIAVMVIVAAFLGFVAAVQS